MKKVLIVEDDTMLADIYRKKFEKIGSFEVIRATSGVEAVEKAKTEIPDLILLDLVLPEMDGFDVLKKLRENKDLDNTRIVPFSNLSQEENREQLNKMGADGFISKSKFTPQQLVTEVENILSDLEKKDQKIKTEHVSDDVSDLEKDFNDILIIEDEKIFLDIFGGKLERAGFKVDKASNGKEGAEFLSKNHYKTVIVDIVLPDFETKKIISEFKKHFPKSKTKFVILKNEADLEKNIKELESIGIEKVIDKNKIEPEQFIKEIKSIQ